MVHWVPKNRKTGLDIECLEMPYDLDTSSPAPALAHILQHFLQDLALPKFGIAI